MADGKVAGRPRSGLDMIIAATAVQRLRRCHGTTKGLRRYPFINPMWGRLMLRQMEKRSSGMAETQIE